ncbi:MAG: DUF2784 family protein [Planctomycetaceae bacterium]
MSALPAWSLEAVDLLFFVLHAVLILFNLTGWIWNRTRHAHLLCVLTTLFSWFVMGAFHGVGYCLCTDWHFQVRRRLGLPIFGHSFLQLAAQVWFGVNLSQTASDLLAGGGLLLIVAGMIIVRVRQRLHQTPRGP